jgi:hypothetical protein
MRSRAHQLLERVGIDPRGFIALIRTWILLDLRSQFYAKATATKPRHVISPLFWVVGQCLTASAITSLVLFARVGAWFYAFVGLSLSMLTIATLVIVEFQEIVFDPNDLEILGPRPVSPQTYAAARLANLFFYVAIMFLALNIFPAIVGAGLRDAGWWYAPAYLVASLAGNTATVGLVIGLMSIGAIARRLESFKEFLAWTQIVLILVVGYGAQLMFRDRRHGFEVWGAFPPHWVRYLPPAWLASFVDHSSDHPGATEGFTSLGLLVLTVTVLGLTLWRISQLYREMGPARSPAKRRAMPPQKVGGLDLGWPAAWLRRETRLGFWLGRRLLAREPNFTIRCLLPLNTVVAVVILGLATGQFGNPLVDVAPERVILPILSMYLIVLAVPPIVHNIAFCRDADASWVLHSAPLERPGRLGLGLCQGVLAWLVFPLCALWGIVCGVAWRDPVSALLHTALAATLIWPTALASLATVLDAAPLSQPPVRAGSLGPLVVPMAAFSTLAMLAVAFHYWMGRSPWFWVSAVAISVTASILLVRPAERRLAQLMEATL